MKARISLKGPLSILIAGILIVGGVHILGALGGTGDPLYDGKTDQTVTGKFKYLNVPANTATGTTISGTSLFNCAITGASNPARSPTSGVSFIMESPSGGESVWFYNDENTTGGNSIYVLFKNGDTVKSNVACTPGVSKYILTGTALQRKLVMWSNGASVWVVDAIGTPTTGPK